MFPHKEGRGVFPHKEGRGCFLIRREGGVPS